MLRLMTAVTTLFWTALVWAQNAAAPAADSAAGATGAEPPAYLKYAPYIVFVVIIYFMILRPQARRQKEHQSFVTNLKRGDAVVTASGIFGKINGITDKFVTLEVSDGVNIRILKSQIASTVNEGAANA